MRRSAGWLQVMADATTLRFLVTGGGAATLFFVLSALGCRAGLPPFAASMLASALSFAAAYAVQRAWTFRGRHSHREAFPRYLATQLACALGGACLARLLAAAGLGPWPMAALTTLASSGTSFVLSRYWVFAGAHA